MSLGSLGKYRFIDIKRFQDFDKETGNCSEPGNGCMDFMASTVIVQRQERATFPCFSSLKTGPIYMYMYHIAFSTGLDDTTTILFELPTEIALLLVAEDSLVHTDFHLFRFLLPLASKYS